MNSIKVFDSLKSELFEIKMDFNATKAFYRFITIGHDTIFDLPSYNLSEVCQIEIKYSDSVKMIFRFQDINDTISEIYLNMSKSDYNEFCYKVFFYLLIDLISSDKDIYDVNLERRNNE